MKCKARHVCRRIIASVITNAETSSTDPSYCSSHERLLVASQIPPMIKNGVQAKSLIMWSLLASLDHGVDQSSILWRLLRQVPELPPEMRWLRSQTASDLLLRDMLYAQRHRTLRDVPFLSMHEASGLDTR